MFRCLCARHFTLPSSLRRHAQSCTGDGEPRNRNEEQGEEGVDGDSEEHSIPIDCVGNVPDLHALDSLLFLIVEDEGLLQINCFINERAGLIICSHCRIAVPPEHLRSHLVTKHDVYRSAEELESILQSHSVMSLEGAVEFVKYTDTVPEPIGGLPIVEEGYKCLVCPYHACSWPVMRNHFNQHHRGKKVNVESEKCPVQLVFHGKLRKYIGITYVKTKEDALRNPMLTDALMREDEEEEIVVPSTKRHKSLRKCSTFVARSRWDILIENEDVEQLRKIASLPQPKEPLTRLVKGTVEYFKRISESVRTGNVLARRWVMSMG